MSNFEVTEGHVVASTEALSEITTGNSVIEEFGAIGLIDYELSDDALAYENMRMGVPAKDRKSMLQAKLGSDFEAEFSRAMKPLVVKAGNEYQFFINESMYGFEEYMKRCFMFLRARNEDEVVKFHFVSTYWPAMPSDFIFVSALIHAIRECKAVTKACCYNQQGFVAALLSSACNELLVSNYGAMTLMYPPAYNWGSYKVYTSVLDRAYDRLIERGLVTREEYEQLVKDSSHSIYLSSQEIKNRTGE